MRPLWLALGQLDDPRCLGVLVRSVALALLAYVLLLTAGLWGIHALLGGLWGAGWALGVLHALAWMAGVLSLIVGFLLAFLLFLPAVLLIATLFLDQVASAVERRHYPWLPPPSAAALHVQAWDGISLAAQVLVLNGVAVLLTLMFPGLGLIAGIVISGWAIGRGLFVAVAMRRMGRQEAHALYRAHRLAVLLPGMVLAAAAHVPLLNLLVPIVGTATMVHVLQDCRGRSSWRMHAV